MRVFSYLCRPRLGSHGGVGRADVGGWDGGGAADRGGRRLLWPEFGFAAAEQFGRPSVIVVGPPVVQRVQFQRIVRPDPAPVSGHGRALVGRPEIVVRRLATVGRRQYSNVQ